ncbi:unnamed protein product [Rotaria magnacalcarata]
MATHYIENASSGNQYYFNTNNATTSSQSYQTYSSPVRSSYNSSTYSAYPVSISGASNQQIHLNNSHQVPQNYLSVGGFNKAVTQHHYHTAQSAAPQTRTTARAISNQDRYHLQGSPQIIQVSPQQNHFQYDTQQRAGHPTGPPVVYQTPGAAQFTHHNVDLWTENPSQTHDHHAQRVSVRSVSTGSPQQSHSISPQRHPDHLQQYYSQLTPEQHQQLLRQQQMQKQQDQTSRHQQQHRVIAQQVSPSSTHQHQQQHYSSTANFDGGQQRRVRSESEKQIQDEQDYYAAQQRLTAQRIQQQQQQQQQQQDPSHPVGIRNLVHKFAEPTSGQTVHSRSKSAATTATSRHYSSSSHTTNSGPRQTTSNRALTSHSMTYSSLPKPVEPPVNSIEYYQMQMQQQGGNPFTNIQQAAAPSHIQHSPTGFGTLRDRFKTGSLSEESNQAPAAIRRQEQSHVQQQKTNASGGNSLSSLRNHYMNQANQVAHDELHAQHVHNISRTILGEEIPQTKPQQQPSTSQTSQEQPAPITKVLQQQPAPTTQAPKQEPAPPVAETPKQESTPVAQAPKQEPAPVTQTPKQEPPPTAETPKQEPPPTAETPKQENAPAAETLKKEAGSATPTVKKEPAPQATKKEPASATQATKKEAASTTQAAKKEATPAADASKQKSTSATETSKKEQPQAKNESVDQKVTSSEVAPPPTVDGEKA